MGPVARSFSRQLVEIKQMRKNVFIERFFNTLIRGDRPAARAVVDEVLETEVSTKKVISHLFWPTLEHLQKLYRTDQLSDLAYHYATHLLRGLADQMQLRLEQMERRGVKVLMVCGAEESEELAAQMASDVLEADGYEVYFLGGGIANDEVVEEIGNVKADTLVIFGAMPDTVPYSRQLIDRLHGIGVCPNLQIVIGGGVFNRVDGLAEEIGADLWANDPIELVELMATHPERRMTSSQRTVGRKRRTRRSVAA